jgi:hypothetical protein
MILAFQTRILREHVPREAEIKSKTRRRRMEVSRWAFVAVLLCFSSRACLAIFDLLSEPLLSHTSPNQLFPKKIILIQTRYEVLFQYKILRTQGTRTTLLVFLGTT